MQVHAVPLVDQLEDVIHRAFDALEEKYPAAKIDNVSESGNKIFNPASPPDLTHTTLNAMVIGGSEKLTGISWNNLMNEVIRQAGLRGARPEKIMSLMEVPAVIGKHDHYSYKYIPEAGISVQGQNAKRAWKQSYRIATQRGISISVKWKWQNKDEAHMPGVSGSMSITSN